VNSNSRRALCCNRGTYLASADQVHPRRCAAAENGLVVPMMHHVVRNSGLPAQGQKHVYCLATITSLRVPSMQKPPLDPDVADEAPSASALTGYDEQNLVTYLRLLDAEEDGADWTEVARIVLRLDPDREPQRARRAWETHLARARWMSEHGYRHLLRGGAPH
jgi:hypothetical protein